MLQHDRSTRTSTRAYLSIHPHLDLVVGLTNWVRLEEIGVLKVGLFIKKVDLSKKILVSKEHNGRPGKENASQTQLLN